MQISKGIYDKNNGNLLTIFSFYQITITGAAIDVALL